jgi:hypothetical protein
MVHRKTSKRSKAKTMLRLADLEQSGNAVLHSLGAASSQESYGHAIDELIAVVLLRTTTAQQLGVRSTDRMAHTGVDAHMADNSCFRSRSSYP